MTDSLYPVSIFVKRQLPRWMRIDHPQFVAFLEAYYEWMEQQDEAYHAKYCLKDNLDVDKTTADFLEFFKKEYLHNIPESLYNKSECLTQTFTVGEPEETFTLNEQDVFNGFVELDTDLSPKGYNLSYTELVVKYNDVGVSPEVTLVGGVDYTINYSTNCIELQTGGQITSLSSGDRVSIRSVSYKYVLTNPINDNTEVVVDYDNMEMAKDTIDSETHTINLTDLSNGYLQLTTDINDWSRIKFTIDGILLKETDDYTIDYVNNRLYFVIAPLENDIAEIEIFTSNWIVSGEKTFCGTNEHLLEFNPATVSLELTKIISVETCENVEVNERLLIKLISDFNITRGTEKSYKFLFRILFNSDVDILYPGKNLLIASDGKWQKNSTITDIYSSQLGGETEIQLEYDITAVSQISKVESNFFGELESGVDYNINLTNNTIEFLVSSKYPLGQLNPSESVTIHVTGLPMIAGSLIEIPKEIILPVISPTTFKYATTLKFNPDTTVYELWLDGVTQLIKNNQFSVYEKFDSSGSHIVIQVDSSVDLTGITNLVFKYKTRRVEGAFVNEDGKLSSIMRLQDSYKYQKFSYIIRSEKTTDQYADIVKRILHPAGLIMFGQISITNCLHVETEANFNVAVKNTIKLDSYVGENVPKLGPTFGSMEENKFRFGLSSKTFPVNSFYHIIDSTDVANGYVDIPFTIEPNALFEVELNDAPVVFPTDFTVNYNENRIELEDGVVWASNDTFYFRMWTSENNTVVGNMEEHSVQDIIETVTIDSTDLSNEYVTLENTFIVGDTIGVKRNGIPLEPTTHYTVDYVNNRINLVNIGIWSLSDTLTANIHHPMNPNTVDNMPFLQSNMLLDSDVNINKNRFDLTIDVDFVETVPPLNYPQGSIGDAIEVRPMTYCEYNYELSLFEAVNSFIYINKYTEDFVLTPTDISNGYVQCGGAPTATYTGVIIGDMIDYVITGTAPYDSVDLVNNRIMLNISAIAGQTLSVEGYGYIPALASYNFMFEVYLTRNGQKYSYLLNFLSDFIISGGDKLDFSVAMPMETFVLTAQDITNGYVSLEGSVKLSDIIDGGPSTMIDVQRNGISKTYSTDFDVDDVNQRIGLLIPGGWTIGDTVDVYYKPLQSGDVVKVKAYGDIEKFYALTTESRARWIGLIEDVGVPPNLDSGSLSYKYGGTKFKAHQMYPNIPIVPNAQPNISFVYPKIGDRCWVVGAANTLEGNIINIKY